MAQVITESHRSYRLKQALGLIQYAYEANDDLMRLALTLQQDGAHPVRTKDIAEDMLGSIRASIEGAISILLTTGLEHAIDVPIGCPNAYTSCDISYDGTTASLGLFTAANSSDPFTVFAENDRVEAYDSEERLCDSSYLVTDEETPGEKLSVSKKLTGGSDSDNTEDTQIGIRLTERQAQTNAAYDQSTPLHLSADTEGQAIGTIACVAGTLIAVTCNGYNYSTPYNLLATTRPVITITAMSYATPVVTVTAAGHGLVSGDSIRFFCADGCAGLNGETFIVTYISSSQFSISRAGLTISLTADHEAYAEQMGVSGETYINESATAAYNLGVLTPMESVGSSQNVTVIVNASDPAGEFIATALFKV